MGPEKWWAKLVDEYAQAWYYASCNIAWGDDEMVDVEDLKSSG